MFPPPQTPLQRLVKRMTRFFVTTSQPETLERLKLLFDGCGYTWRFTGSCTVSLGRGGDGVGMEGIRDTVREVTAGESGRDARWENMEGGDDRCCSY